jgi:cytochrome c553
VQQPDTTKFRLSSPETCIRCHGNEPLMSRYGIRTTVAQTYLADFHGATASLSRNLSASDQRLVVTCNDCHGVHDIASPKLKGPDAMKATVTAACAKCHQDAAPVTQKAQKALLQRQAIEVQQQRAPRAGQPEWTQVNQVRGRDAHPPPTR